MKLADTTPITLQQQRGVFVVFGAMLGLSILLAVGERLSSRLRSLVELMPVDMCVDMCVGI